MHYIWFIFRHVELEYTVILFLKLSFIKFVSEYIDLQFTKGLSEEMRVSGHQYFETLSFILWKVKSYENWESETSKIVRPRAAVPSTTPSNKSWGHYFLWTGKQVKKKLKKCHFLLQDLKDKKPIKTKSRGWSFF